MFGTGFSFSSATFFVPAAVTGANNGLSKNGANIVLGNDAGTGAGGSARLLNNREIDMNSFDIAFQNFGSFANWAIEGNVGDPSIKWTGSFLDMRVILVGSLFPEACWSVSILAATRLL
jgi:hypothetical protein